MLKKLLILLLILPIFLPATESPRRYLEDYLRVRGDLSGNEFVHHLQGHVYSLIPGEKSMELFAYEAYTISRIEITEAGYRILSKEVGLFLDHRTRQIMETWRNPFTQETLPVIQIWNDPVNQSFEYDANTLPFIRQFLPSTDLGESIVYHSEIFPFYPHVLSRRLYGDHVQSEYFQSAELSEYRARKLDLTNTTLSSVPCETSFTWIAPWLPFMKMGDRQGQLLFVCKGSKLAGGFDELPQQLRTYVEKNNPGFASAPNLFSEPNATPWTYFKQRSEAALETN
jgi:hypothetical protein